MRKFIAYIVMVITAFAFIIFNSQKIFENIKNASEYGKGTELSFSITQREDSSYPAEIYGDTYNNSVENLTNIDIKDKIMARINAAGIRDAEINLVEPDSNNEGGRLNIRFSPISDVEKENLKTIITKDGALTIATAGNHTYKMQTKNEFFASKNIASIAYNGTTPFIAISLKNTTDFDDLNSAASTDGEEYSPTEDDSSSENESESESSESEENEIDYKKKLFLWSNLTGAPTFTDTFNKALGLNEEKVDDKCANKLLAVIDVGDYSYDNKMVAITTDKDGNAFTIAKARALTSAINAVDYGFDVEFLYDNTINASFGTNSLSMTYLFFGLGLLLLTIISIAFYGISGLTSSVTTIISILVTILMSSFIGFEFSIALICGLVVLSVFSTLLSVNYFEHTKNFFKKGSPLEKASKDGYKNSFLLSLDAFLILLFASLFPFLFATSSFKTFFGVLMVGSIFTFIITMFLTKWLTYWLVKDKKDSLYPYFSLIKIKKELKVKRVISKKSNIKLLRPLIAVSSFIALVFSIALPVQGTLRNRDAFYFNASDSFDTSYVLNITFNEKLVKNSELVNEDDYINFITKVGSQSSYLTNGGSFTCSDVSSSDETTFKYDSSKTTFVIEEKENEDEEIYYIQYFSIVVNSDLTSIDVNGRSIAEIINYSFLHDRIDISTNDNINRLVYLNGDSNFDSETFVSNCYSVNAVNLNNFSTNLILIMFLINVFCFVYFLIRFGIVISITQLSVTSLFSALSFGLTSLLSIPFNPYTGFAILSSIIILNLVIGTFSTKFRQISKGIKLKTLNDDERINLLNESFYSIFETSAISLLFTIILYLPFIFINSSLISLSLLGILLILAAFVLFVSIFIPLFYILLNKISLEKLSELLKSKRKKKKETKELIRANNDVAYVDQDGPHETIIVGLNEFRR